MNDNNYDWTKHYEDFIRDLADKHFQSIKRSYQQGYIDGRRDEQKKMDPVVSDGTRHGSPLAAAELSKRRRRD
jgi:hypothetical protein